MNWLLWVLLLVSLLFRHLSRAIQKELTGPCGPLLNIPKGLEVWKERGSCSLFPLPLNISIFPFYWNVMEPLLSSLSTTCHCGPHFPKDYCHWPLPFGQSRCHSRCPWLQWLAGRCEGNRYSLSNPYSHIWERESPVDLLTTHHSSQLFSLSFISVCSLSHAGQPHNGSILLPVLLPVKCLDRPLSALMMHRSVNDFKEKQCHLWDLWMWLITDLRYYNLSDDNIKVESKVNCILT